MYCLGAMNNKNKVDIILDGFDCICSLMTKLEMLGDNLAYGDYVIGYVDEDDDTFYIEYFYDVGEHGIAMYEPEEYLED